MGARQIAQVAVSRLTQPTTQAALGKVRVIPCGDGIKRLFALQNSDGGIYVTHH
jgi:hypothetical protein